MYIHSEIFTFFSSFSIITTLNYKKINLLMVSIIRGETYCMHTLSILRCLNVNINI